jgi:hypothetical protein
MLHWLKQLFRSREQQTPKEADKLLVSLKKQWIYPTTYAETNDVYIAAFPKSGVTWLQHLTAGLLYGFDVRCVHDIIVQTLVPDLHALNFYLRTNSLSVFKTHDYPKENMQNVVHLIRDGRDALVSYVAMLRNQGHNASCESLLNESKPISFEWAEHTLAWIANPFGARIIRIHYEDLQLKPIETLERYADFLKVKVDKQRIQEILEQASFANMQAKEAKQGWGPYAHLIKKGKFVRRGTIGAYYDEMAFESLKKFNQNYGALLTKLNYKL